MSQKTVGDGVSVSALMNVRHDLQGEGRVEIKANKDGELNVRAITEWDEHFAQLQFNSNNSSVVMGELDAQELKRLGHTLIDTANDMKKHNDE